VNSALWPVRVCGDSIVYESDDVALIVDVVAVVRRYDGTDRNIEFHCG